MRSRKYFITLWDTIKDKDGIEHNFNLEEIAHDLMLKYTLSYIIHDKEEEEKRHIHIYINNKDAIDFTTLQRINKFFHIEQVKGNDNQIYKYMQHIDIKSKENNKYQYEAKNIKGNYEFIQNEKKETGENLINDIKSGLNLWEIMENNCNLWYHVDKIEKLYSIYQNYLSRKYDLMDLIEKEGKIIKRENERENKEISKK